MAREMRCGAALVAGLANPVIWLIGFALGGNNSPYFATNALLGDYLTSQGKVDLLGPALGWLNGSQIAALFLLLSAGRIASSAAPGRFCCSAR